MFLKAKANGRTLQLSDKSDGFTQLVSIAVNSQTARGKDTTRHQSNILSTSHFTVVSGHRYYIVEKTLVVTAKHGGKDGVFITEVSRFNGCVFVPFCFSSHVFAEMCPRLNTVSTVVETNSNAFESLKDGDGLIRHEINVLKV